MPAPAIAANKEKASELRQKRAQLQDERRVALERTEKEGRAFNPEERAAFDANIVECQTLAERVSQIERHVAVDTIGPDTGARSMGHGLLPHEDPSNAKGRRYSILRAIKAMSEKRAVDGLEGEVSQEIAARSLKSPQGFFIPTGSSRTHIPAPSIGRRREKRALDTTAGAASIQTTIMGSEWIELLRNRMAVMQAGARSFTDLQGKFAIARQTAAAVAYWVGENGAVTPSNQSMDLVNFTPKTIGACTDVSRRFFELTNLDDGEEFVRDDLTAILARGGDLAALNGSGGSTVPLGIMQNTAITSTNTYSLGTNGGPPTFAALIALETITARGNADVGDLAYITNADGRGTMKATLKAPNYPVYLWENDELNGYPAYCTQQLPNNLTKGTGTNLSPNIFGNWRDLIFAYWSGVDILVDPYTASNTGAVRVVALQDLDIQVRHPQSFSLWADMATT